MFVFFKKEGELKSYVLALIQYNVFSSQKIGQRFVHMEKTRGGKDMDGDDHLQLEGSGGVRGDLNRIHSAHVLAFWPL